MIFFIFTGTTILATLALYTRQSLLVAYLLLGAILGPWSLKVVPDLELVAQIGEVGITFLLFLLGLELQPQNLVMMLRKVTLVALVSSCIFIALGYIVSLYFGFNHIESLIIGAALMFSSTIIGLKLLPATVLHHAHVGEVVISVLLMQDLIAIMVILLLEGAVEGLTAFNVVRVTLALPALISIAFLVEKYILMRLLARFDQVKEYVFLLSIGWCMGLAELGRYWEVSSEIGAFIAGVALAASPIHQYIAEKLQPLRDFFLVMFFFSIGAGFNFGFFADIWHIALILAVLMLLAKPMSYYWLLRNVGETVRVASEVGVRLGQASEFSLLVGALAFSNFLISDKANYLIQAVTILTFIVSSYTVVLKYPTPLALTEHMRKD